VCVEREREIPELERKRITKKTIGKEGFSTSWGLMAARNKM